MKEVYDFFELIYSCADPAWFIEIRKLEPLPVTSFWDRIKNLSEWTTKGLEIAKTADSLHFRVVPSKSRDRKDLAMATTLWADVERVLSEEEREALEDLGITPSAVVHSGRGIHMYWALESPVDPETAGRINEALARLLGGDEGAGHPSHTLRFPGSFNCKYIPKKPVTVEIVSGKKYNLSDFSFLRTEKKKKNESSKLTPVSLERLKAASKRCPVIATAFEKPEILSFYAWCSLACVTDEESFVALSSLDESRFDEGQALYRHRYLRERNYRPYGCEKLAEAAGCPRLGRCGLRKVIREQDT